VFDGWNGNLLTVGDASYEVEDDLDSDDGEFTVVQVGECPPECTPITVGGGSFMGEVGWSITDCDGNLVAGDGVDPETGLSNIVGAPWEGCVVLPENYEINMTDSYGDGWNGNVLNIGGDEYTIDAGFNNSAIVGDCGVVGCMDEDACNYDPEAVNEEWFSCVYPNACGDCSEENDLSCIGCMDESACNYDETATVEGTCEYAISGYDCDGNLTCAFDLTTVTYDQAGSWQSENSWSITDPDGATVWSSSFVSSVLTADLCMDPDACYTFTLNDSYGDGWNGNSLDAGPFGIFTVQGGSVWTGSNCVAACEDTEVAAYWLDNTGMSGFSVSSDAGVAGDGGADFDGVVCVDLTGCYSVDLVPTDLGTGEGTLVVGDQEFAYADGTNGGYSSVFSNVIGSGCPIIGCMDEEACNYDELAEEEVLDSCAYQTHVEIVQKKMIFPV
jgi:hypothetical protein